MKDTWLFNRNGDLSEAIRRSRYNMNKWTSPSKIQCVTLPGCFAPLSSSSRPPWWRRLRRWWRRTERHHWRWRRRGRGSRAGWSWSRSQNGHKSGHKVTIYSAIESQWGDLSLASKSLKINEIIGNLEWFSQILFSTCLSCFFFLSPFPLSLFLAGRKRNRDIFSLLFLCSFTSSVAAWTA